MISHLRRTKIVATFGPAITQQVWNFEILNDPSKAEMVKKAYETTKNALLSGVNVVRLNFSHGSYDEQLVRINMVREVASQLKRPVSIMLDTKGPEIRVCDVGIDKGRMYHSGDKVRIYTLSKAVATDHSFAITDSTGTYNMAKDVKVGDTILVDDGKLNLQSVAVNASEGYIDAITINSHLLKTNKRINLPNSEYSIPFLSEKDRNDIVFAIKNKLNYIAASFVNHRKNIDDIKAILQEHKADHIKVIAKIETKQGIDNLDEIISASDGVMIARGDLGLEVPYYEVPYWGKYIIKKCRLSNTPVIMATQMLDSLEENIIPTRAESSDVFWAVELGVDATMLSGESAQGQFPINAINVMSRIDRQSEIFFDYKRAMSAYYPQTSSYHLPKAQLAAKIANAVMPLRQVMNEEFEYQAIAVFTNDYEFLNLLSNTRPASRVLAFTTDVNIYTGIGILYGITPILVKDLTEAVNNAADYIKHYFDQHIQTSNNQELSRKTLVLHDKTTSVIDVDSPINGVNVEFLHQNF